ncbi:MAG TPA: hypothetical protein VMU33_19915 [Burkholderiaceae bacterium]|nr:hypothetical protein [Burkholderiaceae bacterium]
MTKPKPGSGPSAADVPCDPTATAESVRLWSLEHATTPDGDRVYVSFFTEGGGRHTFSLQEVDILSIAKSVLDGRPSGSLGQKRAH